MSTIQDIRQMAVDYMAPWKARGGERLGQFDVGDLVTFALAVAEGIKREDLEFLRARARVCLEDNLKTSAIVLNGLAAEMELDYHKQDSEVRVSK